MALSEAQIALANGLLTFGIEKEAVPFLVAGLKEPRQTEAMIDFLLDNPKVTRADILLRVAELIPSKYGED